MFQTVGHSLPMATACMKEMKMKDQGATVIIVYVLEPIFSLTAGWISLNLICIMAASMIA